MVTSAVPRIVKSSYSDYQWLQPLTWGILFLGFTFWLWQPIRSNDVWWHLITGKYILQNGQVPRVDPFSWTAYGHRWIDFEWIYEVILFLSYQWAGLTGIILLRVALILSLLGFYDLRLKQLSMPLAIRLFFLFLCFWAGRYGWNDRPDLFSLLGTSILLWWMSGIAQKGISRKMIFVIPLFFALWANIHGGFMIGLCIFSLFVYGSFLETGKCDRLLATCWGLSMLAPLLNPQGIHLYVFIARVFTLAGQHPSTEWQRTPLAHMSWYWLCLVGVWISFGIRRYRGISVPVSTLLIVFFLSWLSIRHVRNVPYFLIGALPYMWSAEGPWLINQENSFIAFPVTGILFILSLVFFWHSVSQSQGGIEPNRYPIAACDFIENHAIPVPCFNDFNFGSYWIWRFGKSRPVFVDGRSSAVEGYPELRAEIRQAQSHPHKWEMFLDRYGINSALILRPPPSQFDMVSQVYFPPGQWHLVYQDPLSLLFVRRSRLPQSVIVRGHP